MLLIRIAICVFLSSEGSALPDFLNRKFVLFLFFLQIIYRGFFAHFRGIKIWTKHIRLQASRKWNLHTEFKVLWKNFRSSKLVQTDGRTDRRMKTMMGPSYVTSPCSASFTVDLEWYINKHWIRFQCKVNLTWPKLAFQKLETESIKKKVVV